MGLILRRHRRPVGRHAPHSLIDDSLRQDLIDHLYRIYEDHPRERRRQARWVMSQEWYNEVRKIVTRSSGNFFMAEADIYLFGLPVEVREDVGAPKLVPADA